VISDTRSSANSTMLSTEVVARITVRSMRSTSSTRDVATVPTWSSSCCDCSITGNAFFSNSSPITSSWRMPFDNRGTSATMLMMTPRPSTIQRISDTMTSIS
jgi:hypothetical protein